MSLPRSPLQPNPLSPEDEGVTFSPEDRTLIQAELAHINPESNLGIADYKIDELRRAGVCDLDKIFGDLKSVTMYCIDNHLLNKGEAASLRLIMDNPDLTDEQRSKVLAELLCAVLERHLALLEGESPRDNNAPRSLYRPSTDEITPNHYQAAKKPDDPLQEVKHQKSEPSWACNHEDRPDPNMEYLLKMYEQLREYKRRQERKEELAENLRIKDAFLGKRAVSYPNAGPDIVSEEHDV